MGKTSTNKNNNYKKWQAHPSVEFSLADHLPAASADAHITFANGLHERHYTHPPAHYNRETLENDQRSILYFIRSEMRDMERGSLRYSIYRQAMMSRYHQIGAIVAINEAREATETAERDKLERGIPPPPELSQLNDIVERKNVLAFHEVDWDTYASLRTIRKQRASSYDFPQGTPAYTLVDELDELLPDIPTESFTSIELEPSRETVTFWQPYFGNKFRPLLAQIPLHEGMYRAREMQATFQRCIDYIRDHWDIKEAAGWRAELKPKGNVNVSVVTKTISVPENYTPIDYESLSALVAHECFHLIRDLMGALSSEPLAGVGFGGYDAFEEAMSKFIEMTIRGNTRINGMHYLIAGLGKGMHGEPKLSPQNIHEIIWRLGAIEQFGKSSSQPPKKIIANAKLNSSKACDRVLRGHPGLYLNDLKYVHGVHDVQQYLARLRPEVEKGNMNNFLKLFGAKSGNDPLHLQMVATMSWPENVLERIGH